VGDVIFTTPAIRALRRRYPDAHLTYVVEAAAAPVVRHHPDLNDVIELERPRGLRRLGYDLAAARQLRRRRVDVALDFHGGPRSAWLVRASGAPRRIGYDIPGRRWAYTERVPWHRSLVPPRHSVLNQWDLLAPLGIDPPEPGRDPVRMWPAPDTDAHVRARLRAAGVADDAAIVVLHVSASNPFRRWPRDAFAEVAARLAAADPRRRIIITAGPSEADAAQAITAEARRRAGPAAASMVCDDLSLHELSAVLAHAALFIGGDSGPLHVASTTAVPIVALFGPMLPARSMPWRDPAVPAIALEPGPLDCRPCHQRTCVPGDFRCLSATTPAAVLHAAESLLESRR
jgi:ADP-heptose:LPS heptosyltransferase